MPDFGRCIPPFFEGQALFVGSQTCERTKRQLADCLSNQNPAWAVLNVSQLRCKVRGDFPQVYQMSEAT